MGKCTAIFKLLRWEFCVAPIKKRNTWVLFQSRVKVLVNQMAFRVEIQWMWTYLPHGHFWYPVSAGHNLFSVMTFWKGSKRGTTQSPSFTAICQTGTKKPPNHDYSFTFIHLTKITTGYLWNNMAEATSSKIIGLHLNHKQGVNCLAYIPYPSRIGVTHPTI